MELSNTLESISANSFDKDTKLSIDEREVEVVDNSFKLTKINSNDIDDNGVLNINSKFVNASISEIGEDVISDQKDKIKKIVISDGINKIDKDAFKDLINLKEVIIPQSVTYIDDLAFEGCENLKVVKNINKKEIEELEFENDKVTTNVVIEGSTQIKNKAFYNCKNIEYVTISDTVEQIGSQAFVGTSVENVTLDSKTNIKNDSFENDVIITSNGYKYKLLADGISIIGIDENNIKINDNNEIVIPEKINGNKVVSIEDYAFNISNLSEEGAKKIKDAKGVYISGDVSKIGSNAFKTINSKTNQVTNTFNDLYINSKNQYKYKITEDNKAKLTSYDIDQTVINLTNVKLNGFEIKAIGANAFGSNKDITKLTLPDTVKVINANAFTNCFADNAESIICDDFKIIDLGSCGVIMSYEGKETEVTIPSHYYVSDGQVKRNILTINSNAFMSDNAKNITYIKISYGIQSIGDKAFAKCEKLSGVSIPKSVVDSSNAFKDINNNVINDENSKFQFVYLDDRKETIEIVGYNGEDKNLIIPNQIQYDGKERKVVSVRREAFLGQNNIEKVIINNKNINIGNNTFLGTNIKNTIVTI